MKEAISLEDDALETLVAEATDAYLERCHRGESPDVDSFAKLYPPIAAILRDLLPAVRLMDPSASAPTSPLAQANGVPGIQGCLGEFRLIREIGRGGMGIVYEAEQISLGRRVALKVLPLAAALDPRQLQRFRLEAQAAAHLHHSHIVPIYSVGHERGSYYYAMQFIEGRSLAEVIGQLQQELRPPQLGANGVERRGEAAPPVLPARATEPERGANAGTVPSYRTSSYFPTLASIGIQAAEALEYAHTMGVIHRDIKPANLLLDAQGQLFITDFGLARLQNDAGLTMTGDLLGTLRYMSPEQAMGQRSVVDHRSDLYSLGATLYELLTLRPTFEATDRHLLMRQIFEEEPIAPRQHNPAVPVDLETIVLKAMSKEPEKRYDSARDLVDDLRRYLEHRPILARRPNLLEKAAKWARRHRGLVAAGIGFLLVAALGLAVSTAVIARAEWKTKAAYERLAEEQDRTKASLLAEAEQRQRAETSFRQALDIVEVFTQLGEEELADKPELQGLRRKLLAAALEYYKGFIEQRRDDPSLQAQLAAGHFRMATILDAIGTKAEALAALEQARRLQEKLIRNRPAALELQRGLHTIFNRFGMLRGGRELHLLTQKSVQEDLKLSDAQVRAVSTLEDKRRGAYREGASRSPEEWDKRFAEISEQEAALTKLLESNQSARLRQLALQQRGTDAFNDPEVIKNLDLTEDQQEMIRTVQDETRRAIWSSRSGDFRQEDWTKAEETWKNARAQILNFLSDDQKTRWQELTGEPFKGKFRARHRPGFGPRPGGGPKKPSSSAPTVSPENK